MANVFDFFVYSKIEPDAITELSEDLDTILSGIAYDDNGNLKYVIEHQKYLQTKYGNMVNLLRKEVKSYDPLDPGVIKAISCILDAYDEFQNILSDKVFDGVNDKDIAEILEEEATNILGENLLFPDRSLMDQEEIRFADTEWYYH